MHHKFDSVKAIEAAAVIARCEGKRIGKLRILKLLYLADREALRVRGRPILGSKAVAMDHGPLHSDVYNMIKGEHPASPSWSKYFTQDGKRSLKLTKEPENLALSKSDIAILQSVVDKYVELDDWSLSELTHGFPEWEKTYREGTSSSIELEDIVAAVRTAEEQSAVLLDIADDEAFDRFFERHTQ